MSDASVQLRVYPAAQMSAQDFALLLEKTTSKTTGVLHGCTVTTSATNSVNVTNGWAIIRGRIVRVNAGTVPVTNWPASGTVTRYLVIKVDLANSGAPVTISTNLTSVPSDYDNFNVVNGIAYLTLASITVGVNGVTGVTQVFETVGAGGSAKLSIPVEGWSSITPSGTTLTFQRLSMDVKVVSDPNPEVLIVASGSNVLPSEAEQEAFNLIKYVTVDSDAKKLYLYAESAPTTPFVIAVKGVVA